MSDVRADDDDDRLPWLEAVDEEDTDEGPSAGKLIAYVVVGLIAIGLIVGGLFWMSGRDDAGAEEDQMLIAAPEGDYKVKPVDPGGMKVDARDETALAASQGQTPDGRIDVAADDGPARGGPARSGARAGPGRSTVPGRPTGRTRFRRRDHPARCLRQQRPGECGVEDPVWAIQVSGAAGPQRHDRRSGRPHLLSSPRERPRRPRHLPPPRSGRRELHGGELTRARRRT